MASGAVHPAYHHLHPGQFPRDRASTCMCQTIFHVVLPSNDPGNMLGARLELDPRKSYTFCIQVQIA